MKILTAKQKLWIAKKTINIGDSYMFPRFGFMIYPEPKYLNGEYMDTNPFTRSLDAQMFLVKEKVNGFCRGNFYNNPKGPDWWMTEDELSLRSVSETIFLLITTFIPLGIYNWLKGGVNKIESKTNIP